MLLRTPDADQSGFYVKRFFRSIQVEPLKTNSIKQTCLANHMDL